METDIEKKLVDRIRELNKQIEEISAKINANPESPFVKYSWKWELGRLKRLLKLNENILRNLK